MSTVGRWWRVLSDLGITPDLEISLKKKIRISNRFAVITGLATIAYFFFELTFLPPRETELLRRLFFITHAFQLSAFVLCLVLNSAKHYTAARVALILIASISLLPNTLLLAKPLHIELYMPAIAACAFFLFDNPRTVFFMFLLPIILYMIILFNLHHQYPEIFILDGGAYLRIGISFAVIFVILNLFRIENISHQNDMETKNKILADKHHELTLVNKTKDKIFSIIGHDLRGPVSSLRALLELHGQAHIDELEFRRLNKLVKAKVDNLSSTLDNLLQWSRNQISDLIPNPEGINMNQLTESVFRFISSQAEAKNITLSRHITADAILWADATMIRSVMINLFSNALKFTPVGGAVTLNAYVIDFSVTVTITDTGRGMTTDELNMLFDSTKHITTPGTENEPGTGLGLIICKEFITKNHGTISVESTPGKGSTFTFTLPAQAAP